MEGITGGLRDVVRSSRSADPYRHVTRSLLLRALTLLLLSPSVSLERQMIYIYVNF